jgi:hypothetical protein
MPMTACLPIRLITTVWGAAYLDELLGITLPAILAPGNLPSLVERFACEFALVTERRFFVGLRAHPVIRAIGTLCPVRLIPVDDLLMYRRLLYGHVLTHALHRGFEDLGERVTETNLIFFNSDFVIADGGLSKIGEKIAAGERLIFAPSYCVFAETAAPLLRRAIDPSTGALALPPRAMAALALEHRHNTIRAKTINEQALHMHISDQFYWRLDRDTLLGYQLPIAIVCLRPERPYHKPVSFWDFATLTGAAPHLPRCVLGDSDEFLMLELRSAGLYAEHLRLGPVTPEAVAPVLAGYMTPDQFEMGRYPLVLHAKDLPDTLPAARRQLDAYVDRVYALLPAPAKSPYGHPIWTGLIGVYNASRRDWLLARRRLRRAPGWVAIDRAGTQRRNARARIDPAPAIEACDHPLWALYRHPLAAIARAVKDRPRATCLWIGGTSGLLDRRIEQIPCCHLVETLPELLTGSALPDATRFDLCVIEPPSGDLRGLGRIMALLRPKIRPGGRIVIHVAHPALRPLIDQDAAELLPLLPAGHDRVTIRYAGGVRLARLVDAYVRALLRQPPTTPARQAAWEAQVARALGFAARTANAASAALPADRVPVKCSALTIEITAD